MHFVVVIGLALAASSAPQSKPTPVKYTLEVDTADVTRVAVEMRIPNASASITLAAHAHPEYDDKYWRFIEDFSATDARGRALKVTRTDSVLWNVTGGGGDVVVRYRIQLPTEGSLRAAWRGALTRTGGLVGGPHSFLYVLGRENEGASIALDMPRDWKVATGLSSNANARTLTAANAFELMESPIFVGHFSDWSFQANGIPHRVVYWWAPNATPFDTTAFVQNLARMTRETLSFFGKPPYKHYTFIFQDAAYGGLEHLTSVTLGAESAQLARDVNSVLRETAHEFVHTWNLMVVRPIEYRGVDYRVQPPVAGLWFSEGLTLFYADLLLRRAGLPTSQPTRATHLSDLIAYYLSSPGNALFSAEFASRVAYNTEPDALGDLRASAHLQGELIGAMLDFIIRDRTNGQRSMDDVMRLMLERFSTRGFTGSDVERAVGDVCGCSVKDFFDAHVRSGSAIDFDRYTRALGMRVRVTWEPARNREGQPAIDNRVAAYQVGGEEGVRLRIWIPESVWGRAGLHTSDRVVSVNGKTAGSWPEFRSIIVGLKIGDPVTVVVDRPAGRYETTFAMTGFDVPVVQLEHDPAADERQRKLREAWALGR